MSIIQDKIPGETQQKYLDGKHNSYKESVVTYGVKLRAPQRS